MFILEKIKCQSIKINKKSYEPFYFYNFLKTTYDFKVMFTQEYEQNIKIQYKLYNLFVNK